MTTQTLLSDYARVERAIRFLDGRRGADAALADVAHHVGLSESHFQRLFTRWAGISPKRFVQYQTATMVKRLLRERRSTLDASYEAGLSGPSRLHDLIVNAEAVTPGEMQRSGEGVEVRYGFHPTPFGECLLAQTSRGICYLAFVGPVSRSEALGRLRHDWSRATLIPDPNATRLTVAKAFPPAGAAAKPGLALHVKGTNFQLKVWSALLLVPSGNVTTYGAVAQRVGDARASRAVGTAVGDNPISYLIPCHRVIRATGDLGGYAWGLDRKNVMLRLESASVEPEPDITTRGASRRRIPAAASRIARVAS